MLDTNHQVRARLPHAKIAIVLFMVSSTLVGAAANMMPFHMPTAHELQQIEQAETVATRRERIALLQAEGDRCRVEVARELARALVFDGQSAVSYADDFERRCGNDFVVRKWASASRFVVRTALR